MKYSISFIVITFLLINSVFSSDNHYTISAESVLNHISVLADDSLEGRKVGDIGEFKAAEYIARQFKINGLAPKGDEGYYQYFEFVKQIDFGQKNYLSVNGVKLILSEDFEPMKQSASTTFEFSEIINADYGITTKDSSYDDYEGLDVSGKAVIIKRFAPSSEDNPHVDFEKYTSLTDKIQNAMSHDAGAVIFITPEDHDDTLNSIFPVHLYPKDIPILYLRRNAMERLQLDLNKPEIKSISGEVELIKIRDTSQNVVGFIQGKSDTTIIIGAHYDHLGWGGPTSRYHDEPKMIHNGADDNASGVAALIELGHYFKSREDLLNYSMIYIAFGGEEEGLLGSKKYADNMTVDSKKIRMMLNMDMIGRLKDQDNGLAVLGTGTCQAFKNYFDSTDFGDMILSLKESGTGPSDHAPYYNLSIPVLHFFTGAHEDYHKPSDDIDKIDNEGIVRVSQLIAGILENFNNYDQQITFTKTKDSGEGKRRAQYSVTLGIMPDYVAEVKGVKVDGVVDDRPGAKAGILKDDVILKMGQIDINDIYDYMNALSKFRKGDTTIVIVERSGEKNELEVIFK